MIDFIKDLITAIVMSAFVATAMFWLGVAA